MRALTHSSGGAVLREDSPAAGLWPLLRGPGDPGSDLAHSPLWTGPLRPDPPPRQKTSFLTLLIGT